MWSITAYAACAPIDDRTVTKEGLVARFRGEDAGDDNWGGNNPGHYAHTLTNNGYPAAFVRSIDSAAILESVIGDVDLDDGEPHHLALVRDNIDLEMRLNVDGVEIGTDALLSGVSDGPFVPGHVADIDPVRIGGQLPPGQAVSEQTFEGLIHDAKLYDRTLSSGDTEAIAGCGVPVFPRFINLKAQRFESPAGVDHGLCILIDAGEYVVTVASPDEEGAALHSGSSNSRTGAWGAEFQIEPEIGPGLTFGQVPTYPSANEAFDGLATKAFILNISAEQRVDPSVQDLVNLDNRGGVSIRVEQYVPEPGFGLALFAGCALLAQRKRHANRKA